VPPSKRSKAAKDCNVCQQASARLYRVKTDARDWTLVCDSCWSAIKDEPGYTYGGTWTTRKR
jgi:predicted SprT family Zn-dependent metalloprotease